MKRMKMYIELQNLSYMSGGNTSKGEKCEPVKKHNSSRPRYTCCIFSQN